MQTTQKVASETTDTTTTPTAPPSTVFAAAIPRTCPLRSIHAPLMIALRYKHHALGVIISVLAVGAYVTQMQQLETLQDVVKSQTDALDDLEQRFTQMGEQNAYQEPTSCNRTPHMHSVIRHTI